MPMIKNNDRSGWFGASDTNIIMSNWNTKTFAKWWLEKLGIIQNTYKNNYMLAGTYFEHSILDFIGVTRKDRQIKNKQFRLRVNLDGETKTTIKEVKTYASDHFKVSLAYWRQAQIQMFISGKKLDIVAYKLEPEDYKNFYRAIDKERLSFHPIEYDQMFVAHDYLPRVKYLATCMKKGKTPKIEEYVYVHNKQ